MFYHEARCDVTETKNCDFETHERDYFKQALNTRLQNSWVKSKCSCLRVFKENGVTVKAKFYC